MTEAPRRTALTLSALLVAALTAPTYGQEDTRPLRAHGIIKGPGGIEGIITFKQPACAGCPTPGLDAPATDQGFRHFPQPTVEVTVRVSGPAAVLQPGAHGMHLHEFGVCEAGTGFTSAGGHFDPGPFGHSNPVDANHPFHSGDLPNLIVNSDGVGFMKHTTSRITLSPGPLSIFDADGTAVIVHLNPDRGINGVLGASGGPRVACGVVQWSTAGQFDDDE
jgi:Cu-Zn family superoxide dismutase